ncbi:SRPBCC family protein [Tropicibacter sp. Alg240-R139]|uniref:SRPBCC family protein n=1 Tax=Tropicibacter sp. Alg240-R139 TaxID=2305991 RepID=UPI0013E040E6|nr:SRPBCC family protein [Tropicibacter sp. Alg240-R139]
MIHFERNLSVDATQDEVWTVLGRFMQIDSFAPEIVSVDALMTGDIGVGSKRRNQFKNGTSLVEEVTDWVPQHGYTVKLSEMAAMPLHEASADIHITSVGGQTLVIWSFDCHVKYGLLGWLLGQTLMKMMMGKIIDGNLRGLAEQVHAQRS